MTITTPDYSLPPQRILNIYDPDAFPPHTLVTENSEGSYRLGEINFHAVNLYTMGVKDLATLPIKGEPMVLEGATTKQLYAELNKLGHKVVLPHREPFAKELQKVAHHLSYGFAAKVVNPLLAYDNYHAFVAIAEKWQADRSNIKLTYDYINEHPMFWQIQRERSGERFIVSGIGFTQLQFDVMKNKVVTIEAGPGNYHDYNLDAYGDSFDKALINFAKLLHTHYDLHGSFTDTTKREPNDNFAKVSTEK